MKFLVAKSCNGLLGICILVPLAINVLFCLINNLNGFDYFEYGGYLVTGVLQLLFGLLAGLLIRKQNKSLLTENTQEKARKRYAMVALFGLLLLLFFFLFPDTIAGFHLTITLAIYRATGLDRLFTMFDFGTIFICLGSVFLSKKQAVAV